jgi:hypothetical protein
MRRSTSTIRRVQDLLSARRERRLERTGRFQSAEARAARTEADSTRDEAFTAGRPVPPLGGGPPSGP